MAKVRRTATPRVSDLCDAMERIAPRWAAADWDNVGLLVGDVRWPAKRVLLTIDLTPAVLDEAIKGKCDAVLAYHPVLFKPVARLTPDLTRQDGVAAEALSRRIAVYSPHTALDAAPGGTNETLAELAGLTDLAPFRAASSPASQCKLVVFVPQNDVECVAEAAFAAGAGRIGDYEKCSYRLSGQGTFFGTETTSPVVGSKGRLERVDEIRIEIVLPKRRLAEVVSAVRQSHPYEEPAFDVYPLEAAPLEMVGQGRIGRFEKPIALSELAQRLKTKTRAAYIATVGKPSSRLQRGFVCVGAAGSLPFDLPSKPCGAGDVIITGEIRHHDALRYQRAGATAIAMGHWTSERPALASLAKRLKRLAPGLTTVISKKDCEPFTAI